MISDTSVNFKNIFKNFMISPCPNFIIRKNCENIIYFLKKICYNFVLGDIMSKIKLKSCLISSEDEYIFEGYGILNSDKINFLENDVNVTIHIYENSFSIIRKTDEYELIIDLSPNKKSSYYIKKIGFLNVEVDIIKMDIKKNRIYCEYRLNINNTNIDKFTYNLTYETL